MTPSIIIDDDFYPRHDTLFEGLMQVVNWDESMKARKTASFGKPYDYSQMAYATLEIPPVLLPIRNSLADRLDVPFNNCLLNLYETGRNTMGFHSDEVSGLLPGTGVAILSLGSERAITFRSVAGNIFVDYRLKPGSLLYMGADVQSCWMHSIKKCDEAGARISLTWRAIQ